MNSQNVEKAKKILIPSFLTIGGLWISYVGYFAIPIVYGFWKFARFKPTNEMLEKAWEGFEYDPEINTIQSVYQVLKRSSTLFKEIMPEFTQLSKKLRQSDKIEEVKEFITSVKQEMDQKLNQSRMCVMHFLQYKNHSFEQFYQRNFEMQNDELILRLIVDFDMELFICHDRFKHKLPTISQCIDYLKRIIPFINEKKPQIDRLRHMILQNGLDQYRFIFCIVYLSDLLEPVLDIQYQTLQTALKLINFNKVQPTKRVELEKLWEEHQQLLQSIIY